MTAHVLVVEDDEAMLSWLDDELVSAGYSVLPASSASLALEHVSRSQVDVVVTDLVMPGMRGDELLRQIRSAAPTIPVVIMTAFGSIESAVDAMREGAFHYITKPFAIEQLLKTIQRALEEGDLRRELQELRTISNSRGFISHSPLMQRTLDLVARAAPADTPVLVLGESGTGKELIARALHQFGNRRSGPFVAINCSAIPETLLESQLFGHRRGAFTDAREERRGLFQEAHGGTLLLDEIGDLAPSLQAKLLRVLQEKEVLPLGAGSPIPVDVRVVAATHRNLEVACREGRFRQDLFYRLNVITITVPPLRERPEDVVPLIAHFLSKHGPRLGRGDVTIGLSAMHLLRSYPWPGNVRELENAIERALVLGHRSVIGVEDLPDTVRHAARRPSDSVRSITEVEREQILKALASVGGNKAAAARLLGLDRKTLYRKLGAYGIG